MRPAEKRERLQRFAELCRQRGLALTVQRRAVLEVVLDRQDHPTPDRVYEEVKERIPNVSRTTVYRVLDKLVEIGVVTKACTPRAAMRIDPHTHRHHHLICLHCDKLIDLEDERLDQHVQVPDVRAHAFQIQDFSIHFHGICADCRRKLRPKQNRATKPSARARKRNVERVKEPRTSKRR